MGFDIFASGTDNFQYSKKGCADDSDFDMVDLLGKLQNMEPTWMGAGATAVDIVQPSAGIIDAMKALATIETLHLLSNAVCFLALKNEASRGKIFVAARESHLLWPDTGDNGEYKFKPGESPGHEFIKKIGPALKAADLASWGVLLQLAICLAKYEHHMKGERPFITIQVSH